MQVVFTTASAHKYFADRLFETKKFLLIDFLKETVFAGQLLKENLFAGRFFKVKSFC